MIGIVMTPLGDGLVIPRSVGVQTAQLGPDAADHVYRRAARSRRLPLCIRHRAGTRIASDVSHVYCAVLCVIFVSAWRSFACTLTMV